MAVVAGGSVTGAGAELVGEAVSASGVGVPSVVVCVELGWASQAQVAVVRVWKAC